MAGYWDQVPGKYQASERKVTEEPIERNAEALTERLNPFSDLDNEIGRIPFYASGARAFLKIGGKPVGVARSIRWKVAYNATPINTIDSPHAWDIDIGQASVSAQLDRIMDPTRGPEAEGLFHTMKSAIHQPMVELQVIDRQLGTSIFFARGMFTEVDGSLAHGSLGSWSARFMGTAYQHYVSQQFKPYDSVAGALDGFVNGLQGIASDLSGGTL